MLLLTKIWHTRMLRYRKCFRKLTLEKLSQAKQKTSLGKFSYFELFQSISNNSCTAHLAGTNLASHNCMEF